MRAGVGGVAGENDEAAIDSLPRLTSASGARVLDVQNARILTLKEAGKILDGIVIALTSDGATSAGDETDQNGGGKREEEDDLDHGKAFAGVGTHLGARHN